LEKIWVGVAPPPVLSVAEGCRPASVRAQDNHGGLTPTRSVNSSKLGWTLWPADWRLAFKLGQILG